MQAVNGRLILSPSDLNDYVECPHLTTLALEVARGTRPRPYVAEDHVDLLRRKGEAHEAAYLEALRAAGREIVDVIGPDRWDFEGSARATEQYHQARLRIAKFVGVKDADTLIFVRATTEAASRATLGAPSR